MVPAYSYIILRQSVRKCAKEKEEAAREGRIDGTRTVVQFRRNEAKEEVCGTIALATSNSGNDR
jgi:hypothetical protein